MDRIIPKTKLVILASGRGSNFKAIAEAIDRGTLPHSVIAGLISNRKDAPVLHLAKQNNIPHFLIESSQYVVNGSFNRIGYEEQLLDVLNSLKPDLICLAGYLLLLGSAIIKHYPNRIINIHPSLLPAFKGLHAQAQAIRAGVSTTGCTVHWVTDALDAGPIILQKSVPILPNDTEESLSLRMLPIEHQTYIEALNLILTKP
ncbi:MAG: phosphoribosylglycinamide formyltransferase [Proteobacteria bacterium]|nr:phosphoribosylglycinamide formyltransferase [Pseudomonadota bacterium]NDC25991.1 phosphoribosylglycinamide formyltransferase [Pseudomonadota bacterium]NDD05844.1 phosphoribosylglycinamide formyltransferase [Pseudomonadota bacterium]NDG25900.1 phosphoribosylglycinamide formyltransferase [Pseudomonadota bacterium]